MYERICILHRLDLLVRVMETVTGNPMVEASLRFYKNGEEMKPLPKGNGIYILMNIGREDFYLSITANGFVEKKILVRFEELDESLPALEICLIPNEQYRTRAPCHIFKGSIPGLVSVDAVKLSGSLCQIKDYKPHEKILNIFNPHRIQLTQMYYGLLDLYEQTYQPFIVKKRISDTSFYIDREIPEGFASHDPIARMLFAHVAPNGSFRFMALKDSADARFLLRFQTRRETMFRVMDFNTLDTEI